MTNEVDRLQPVQGPSRVGQATAVEQSRAVAEVLAAVRVAQECPRDVVRAEAAMRRACREPGLAGKAFYAFPRAGGAVNGPSIHLARALAALWGNLQYSVDELRRDDGGQQSEMKAWAWDVETNVRVSATFIVPHLRDTTGGPKPLREMRDIYENNANNGARRVRESIFALLPPGFVDEAKRLCHETLLKGDGSPLDKRRADAVAAFGRLRVSQDRVEKRVGRPVDRWDERDIADLGILFASIDRGELAADVEFPAEGITLDDLRAPAANPGPAPVVAQPAAAAVEQGAAAEISQPQWRRINERFNDLGVKGGGQAAARLRVICALIDRQVAGGRELTGAEAQQVLDNLAGEAGERVIAQHLGAGSAGDERTDDERAVEQVLDGAAGQQAAASPIGGHLHEHDPQTGAPITPAEDVDPGAGIDPTLGDDWPPAPDDEQGA